jgi:co-chaperonin GroES (HSP10)
MTLAKEIDQLLNKQLRESNISVQPCFPWVLLRVCKKEQERNGLWLPDSTQNKTLHEGIVLSTWQPCQRVQSGYTINLSSELRPGNHVLFNHFAGVPLEGRSSGYRLVKECNFAVAEEGGIIATVEYQELYSSPTAKLRALLDQNQEWAFHDTLIEKITERFILVDRDTPSVTISGR